jgi:large subunit ribosomal protein L10
MNPDKQIIIDQLLERVNASPFVLVVEYTGMSVPQFSELRNRLAEGGAECHVAKNTHMKRVLNEAGLPDLSESLVGQTAFITGEQDVCAAAKAVANFTKEFKMPTIKGGVLDGSALDAAQVQELSKLPSREVLLGQLLGVINAPATKLLRTINEPGGSLARVIKAKNAEG